MRGRHILFLAASVYMCACQSSNKLGAVGVDNDVWLFSYDSSNVGIGQRWYSDTTNRSNWVRCKSGYWPDVDGMDYDGAGWYASTFVVPDSMHPWTIFFGGVDDNADVWVNGKLVGSHEGYNESFYFDLADLHVGENNVVVRVFDRGGPGGLYKPVKIVKSSEVKKLLKSKFADLNARPSPVWIRDAVIYEVYLRSFAKEGTFKGLQKRLPELKALGVTVLWLMPIQPIGELGRKGKLGSPYAVRDYYGINPEFGTLDDFKSLVNAIHKAGMKAIIDLVANHTSWDSNLMFDHPEWFAKNKKGAIVSPNPDWWDVAQLDYRHHELRKYMINVMTYWVRETGIDGYRCDVADLLPLDFWETAREELDAIKPVMMLAEGNNPADHLKAFDLTYSWNFYKVLVDVVRGSKSVSVFDQKLDRERLTYPKGSLRLRFISNHDKNIVDGPPVKLYTRAGAKAAAVWLFTFPGVPLIYNGDEVGNPKKLSLFDKVDIDWSKGGEFRELYTKLIRIRNEHRALREGNFKRLWCSDSARVYAFERQSGKDVVDVVINFSKERRRVKISAASNLVDAGDETVFASKKKKAEITLAPYGFHILISSPTKE